MASLRTEAANPFLDTSNWDEETLVVTLAVLQLIWLLRRMCKRKRKRERLWWVHPINIDRHIYGEENLMSYLRQDDQKFHKYFRMDQSTFDKLLGYVINFK